jgi:hypothetical protein
LSHFTDIHELLIKPDQRQDQTMAEEDDEFGLVKALAIAIPASLAILVTGVLGIFLGDIVQALLGL